MSDKIKNNLPAETEDIVDKVIDVVSDQTIPAPIRKGLTEVCKGLGIAMVENAAGYFERRSTEKWAETNARVKIIEEAGDQIRRQIEVDPEFPQRASNTFAKQILREQLNREQVLGKTADILKEKKYDNSTNEQFDNEPETPISEDWFNNFEKEASQKSSEDMQRRFAKVLAGEIQNPGLYSIKTVKALGDMDQNISELFQKLCSMSVLLEDFDNNNIYDIRVLSLGQTRIANDLRKYGLSLADILMLIEYDLVTPNLDTVRDYGQCIFDEEKHVADPFQYQGQYWILEPSLGYVKRDDCPLTGIKFSYVGSQLFHIVEQIPTEQYTTALKDSFARYKLEMVQVSIERMGPNVTWVKI